MVKDKSTETIEKQLNQYLWMIKDIDAMNRQIENLYRPIKSPVSNGSHGSTPGDPTGKAAMKILEIEEKIGQRKSELTKCAKKIEDWIITLNDCELESIIRLHYLVGDSWQEVDQEMYGIGDGNISRRKCKRFMKSCR